MKLRYAVIALSLFGSLYAGKATHETPPPILRKCPPNDLNFEFFGQWLFLQPNGSNIYYAAEAFPFNTSIAVPAVSPNWKIFEIDPDYHSGFEVGLNWLLPKSDMNIELNWERLHAQDKDSMHVTPLSYATGNMVGPIYDIGPNSAAYTQAKGKAIFHFDEANLFVGKSICFVKNLRMRLHLGASFAKIKQKITSQYANDSAQTNRNIATVSNFWGVGPQLGLDLDFRIVRNFYFTGNSNASLYMGRLRNHTTFKSNTPALAAIDVAEPNVQHTKVPNRSQLVPGFEERLGFAYWHFFKHCEVNLGVGYVFQIYLNAVQSVDMLTQALPNFAPGTFPTMGVFAVTFNRTLSNFILTGPYVSLNIGF
jgi:hypothetical protein